jgi:tetratricopeptide (TPR) repeat protein
MKDRPSFDVGIVFLFLLACVVPRLVGQEPEPDSRTGRDPLLNTRVFWKDTAVSKVGNDEVDKSKELPWSALVEDVDRERVKLGQTWVQRSDVMTLDEAFDYYDKEVRHNPTSVTAWRRRAICWLEKGGFNNALKDFDEVVRLDPKRGSSYYDRGVTKMLLGKFKAAVEDYDEAIRLDPKHESAYHNRGVVKLQYLKEFEGAVKDFDELIRLDPQESSAYAFRAHTKHLLKDYQGAIRDYDEVIRRYPEDWSGLTHKSLLLTTAVDASIRDAKEGARLADESLKISPDNPFAMNAKACACALEGNWEDAIAWQRKAMEEKGWLIAYCDDGGVHAKDRIAKWEAKELWLQP